jgi:hypothetical protein
MVDKKESRRPRTRVGHKVGQEFFADYPGAPLASPLFHGLERCEGQQTTQQALFPITEKAQFWPDEVCSTELPSCSSLSSLMTDGDYLQANKNMNAPICGSMVCSPGKGHTASPFSKW